MGAPVGRGLAGGAGDAMELARRPPIKGRARAPGGPLAAAAAWPPRRPFVALRAPGPFGGGVGWLGWGGVRRSCCGAGQVWWGGVGSGYGVGVVSGRLGGGGRGGWCGAGGWGGRGWGGGGAGRLGSRLLMVRAAACPGVWF